MNILTAASRHWHPQEEWVLSGIRNLMEEVLPQTANWLLYDRRQNPDIPNTFVHSANSFHHNTAQAFSLAIVAGGENWSGPALKNFYQHVLQARLPLFALGLGIAPRSAGLSKKEVEVYKRRSTVIAAKNVETKNYFRELGIESTMLPCPSLFATNQTHSQISKKQIRVGFFMDSYANGATLDAPFIRHVNEFIAHSSDSYQIEVLCPTANDLLHYHSLFGEKCFYSYDAHDYLLMFSKLDVLVTNNITAAHTANSVGRVALYVSERQLNELEFVPLPFIVPTTLRDLEAKFRSLLGKRLLPGGVESWKNKIKAQWRTTLPQKNSPIREVI